MEVPACERVDGVAAPDPCLLNVRKLDDGDILLIGISSQASSWNFGLRAPRQIGGTEPSPTASTTASASASPSGSADVTPPTITGSADQTTISPNGDGRLDALDVEVIFSEPVTWTFDVHYSGPIPVFSASGQGGSAQVHWDGQGAEEGTYGWSVTAEDAAGNEAHPFIGAVTIDVTEPSFTVGAPRRASKKTPIRVTVEESASVKVTIRRKGRLVKKFGEKQADPGRTVTVVWRPRNAKTGRYKIVVTVTDLAANTSTTKRIIRVS